MKKKKLFLNCLGRSFQNLMSGTSNSARNVISLFRVASRPDMRRGTVQRVFSCAGIAQILTCGRVAARIFTCERGAARIFTCGRDAARTFTCGRSAVPDALNRTTSHNERTSSLHSEAVQNVLFYLF